MTVVLDSWAIIRYLEDRGPAAEHVATLLASERPIASWMNLGEVFYVVRRATNEEAAMSTLRDLRAALTPDRPTESRIVQAARIKAEHPPMAYADAFAAATALGHDAILWTGDPELLVDGSAWKWRDIREAAG